MLKMIQTVRLHLLDSGKCGFISRIGHHPYGQVIIIFRCIGVACNIK